MPMTTPRPTARWTYELPPGGSGPVGLEDYQVADERGEHQGNVLSIVERDGERYLIAEVGVPPVRRDRRAIPWSDVVEVDHERLLVRVDGEALARSIAVSERKGVEQAPAEAARITEPFEPPRRVRPEAAVPASVPRYAVAGVIAALFHFSLLCIVLLDTWVDFTWHVVLWAIPGVLGVAGLAIAYRLLRRPYE